MSHPQQVTFVHWVRNLHPIFFSGKRVLDCGSMDVNGNCRAFFKNPTYWGIDVGHGPNVDQVCPAFSFKSPHLFDVVISTEMLEHSKTWREDLQNMVSLVKSKGLLLITAGGDGRAEHGTTRCSPWASSHTNDYYKNISNEMFARAVSPRHFDTYFLQQKDADLQFFGIKK